MISITNFLLTSQLSNYLFASLSVYTLYAIIYERLLMHPYYNNENGETEYQLVPAVLLFWERNFSWAFVELFAEFKIPKVEVKDVKFQIPWKISSIFGIIKFTSIALFLQGIYQTNFRFGFMIRTGLFVASSVISFLYNKIYARQLNLSTKFIEIICALLVLGGMILFWIYDPEICFYVPIQPRVKGAVMIIGSVLLEGLLGIVRTDYIQKEKVNPLRMHRDIDSWVVFLSYLYLLAQGSFADDFKFAFKHLQYLGEVLVVGLLVFLAQVFEFKACQVAASSSGYLTSAGMFLTIVISYTFSVHEYYRWQVLGVVASVGGIVGGLLVLGKREETKEILQSSKFKPYEQVSDLEIEQ